MECLQIHSNMRFYTDAKEKDLWDGDYNTFYNFMVENRV